MKKFIGILVAVAIVAAIAVPRVMDEVNKEPVAETVAVITVGGEAAVVSDLTTRYELIGNTYSNKTVPVMPSIPAEVLSIEVEIGDYVEEGDLLFTLDTDSIDSQMTQAEFGRESADAALNQAGVGVRSANAGVNSAQLAYDMAKSSYEVNLSSYNFSVSNLEKYEQLFNEGIISEMEYEQMKLQANPETLNLYQQQLESAEQSLTSAKLAVEQANSAYTQANVGVKQAEDAVESASDALVDMTVTAPVSGYITAQNLTEDVIAANSSVAIMIDELDIIEVTASVTANQVGNVHIGDKVDVYVSAVEKSFEGRVEYVSMSSDARTMLYPVSIKVNNPDLEIVPGMFATVSIVDKAVENAIIVPTEALVVRNGVSAVFVFDGVDKAVMKEVVVGAEDGYNTEIVSGVEEGEIIITEGVGLIDEETIIEVVRGDE